MNAKSKWMGFFTMGVLYLAVISLVGGAAEKKQYRLRFKSGDKYYVRIVVESKIIDYSTGEERPIELTEVFGYNFDVTEVDENGSALIRCTYKRVSISRKTSEGEIAYDSLSKNAVVPVQLAGFVAILEESFYLRMTSEGYVEKINGLGIMRSKAKMKIPNVPQRQEAIEVLGERVNEAVIKESFESCMVVYPDEAVGLGDSWTKVADIGRLSVIAEEKLTLKERKDGVATIELTSVIRPKLEVIRRGGEPIKFDLSGKRAGQIEMSESTGRIIHSTKTEDISGKIIKLIDRKVLPVNRHIVTTFEMSERKE